MFLLRGIFALFMSFPRDVAGAGPGTTVTEEPIVQVHGACPPLASMDPSLQLTTDVPAYAVAMCRNGNKLLASTDDVNFFLGGAFDDTQTGDHCVFFKKPGNNTYTVDVEVGWGEPNSPVLEQRRVKTITCSYDIHGGAVSSSEAIHDWKKVSRLLNPMEQQYLMGDNSTADFDLEVWDVLDERITAGLRIGRKVRLVAYDNKGSIPGLRPLSCVARNENSLYYVIRAGCGDGLVFPKVSGFRTEGNCVYSPYFTTFKLDGGDSVEFECVLTVCDRNCDGSSCPTESAESDSKAKRSVPGPRTYIRARSSPFHFS